MELELPIPKKCVILFEVDRNTYLAKYEYEQVKAKIIVQEKKIKMSDVYESILSLFLLPFLFPL